MHIVDVIEIESPRSYVGVLHRDDMTRALRIDHPDIIHRGQNFHLGAPNELVMIVGIQKGKAWIIHCPATYDIVFTSRLCEVDCRRLLALTQYERLCVHSNAFSDLAIRTLN